jgi:hypothetical protein
MVDSISPSGNAGPSQVTSSSIPTLQDVTDLDKKIQKKAQGILYKLFGLGGKEVKQLRVERFEKAEALINSLNKNSPELVKSLDTISLIMQKEVARLEKRGGNASSFIDKHQNIREAVFNKRLELTGSSVISFSDIKINGKAGDKTKFSKGNKINGDFEFSLKTATGDLNVKGAGETEGRLNAQGGYGRVYFGERNGKKVAVKVMEFNATTKGAVEREVSNFSGIKGGPHVMGAHEVVHIMDDEGNPAYV